MRSVEYWILKFSIISFCACLEARKLSSWRDQDTLILGSPPKERFGHGFAETLGRLYVFGGTTFSRGICDECDSDSRVTLLTFSQGKNKPTLPKKWKLTEAHPSAVLLNDMHQFDLATLTWTDLSGTFGPNSDRQPTPRFLSYIGYAKHAIDSTHGHGR